ncbi:hypothetical protein O181_007745 [Austropuccinia psidii MF-1]|uniref:CCHC-type domain-containing protein n=1 Tax=Austropuccinia psidii MF-1 TaxID=1389203 RepID=A0A9Q3BNK9_9BASI|nr:hypothetical protein [Austropuccinia psidii MF-1]
MEAAIQFNQMDLDKEEVRPEHGLPSLPQERHVWRMPELPPIPQGLNHFQVEAIDMYQSQYKKLVQSSKRRGVGNMPKPLAGGHELLLTHQELSWSGEDHRTLRRVEPIVLQRQDQKKEVEMTPALEEGPVASTSSKPAPETSEEKPKGPQKKKKVGMLHSLFTRTAKKWYYKMRLAHGKHDWPWWKCESITKWPNNSCRFKMENAFESAILNSEKDQPLTWFLKQKDRLSALHSDISDAMINTKILRKCGGELEHAIKCRCVEPCSTEDYINAMEDIITETRIGKTWTRVPMRSKMVSKTSSQDERPERAVLKCHKCGSTSHLAKTCTKTAKINEAQVIEEAQCTEEKEQSDLDSAVSEDTPVEDYPIENITAFFEVTEVHTHLPHYSEDFNDLINIQDARMCKTKPARGKGYTVGASCIPSILINDTGAKVNLDTGEFCTCVGKDYLQAILPGWKDHLLPTESVKFSSDSNNMYPLGILDTNIVFPHPAGSVRMKTEIVVMDNCTSQHIILGNDYLNIYGIDINNHEDRYFTIGENKRQKFAFCNMPKQITVISSVKDAYKEEFVPNQLVEPQIKQ